jgi:serine/threonine protein kinase
MTESDKKSHHDNAAIAELTGDVSTTKVCVTCHNTFLGELSHCPSDATPLVSLDPASRIGTLVGKYRIISLIGGGGMGVVYKAEQIVQQRLVALKMIRAGLTDSGIVLRFQQEARAVSSLNHPNIVTVYECAASEDGTPYLAMEYIDGTTLADEKVKLDMNQAVEMFIQLCDALAHAHAQGVIHRDLKPGNIISRDWSKRGPELHVKVLDFGIAKFLPSSGKEFLELTRTGQPIGSPWYMSPEQCRAEDLDARSDIYSLGCVMYKVISGKRMFEGDSLFEVISKHLTEPAAPFKETCPELHIPIELEEIVLKALEKTRDKRFQSMMELKKALELFRDKKNSSLPFWFSRWRRSLRYGRLRDAYAIIVVGLIIAYLFFTANSEALQGLRDKFFNMTAEQQGAILKELQRNEDAATLLWKMGKYDEARTILTKSLNQEKQLAGSSVYNQVRRKTLQDVGYVDLQKGNYPAALSELEKALKLAESDSKTQPSERAAIMGDIAETKRRLGDCPGALAILKQAKTISKDDPDILSRCLMTEGCVREMQQDYESAKATYSQAIKLRRQISKDTDANSRWIYDRLAAIAKQCK